MPTAIFESGLLAAYSAAKVLISSYVCAAFLRVSASNLIERSAESGLKLGVWALSGLSMCLF